MRPGPEHDVVAVYDQRAIEPVLHHSVRLPNSVGDRVQLEVSLDKVPGVLVAWPSGRHEGYGTGDLLIVVPRAEVREALTGHVRFRNTVAATDGPVLGDSDEISWQRAKACLDRAVILYRQSRPAPVLVVLLDVKGQII